MCRESRLARRPDTIRSGAGRQPRALRWQRTGMSRAGRGLPPRSRAIAAQPASDFGRQSCHARSPTRNGVALVVYREGDRWHVLVHNEFHDAIASSCASPATRSRAIPAGTTPITYAVSTDGARYVLQARRASAHGSCPRPTRGYRRTTWRCQPDGYTRGRLLSPSKHREGQGRLLLLVLMAISDRERGSQMQGLCVFRTRALGDPSSWRAWDGSGFNLQHDESLRHGRRRQPVLRVLGGFVIPSHLDVRHVSRAIHGLANKSRHARSADGDLRNLLRAVRRLDPLERTRWSSRRRMPVVRGRPAKSRTAGAGERALPSIMDHEDTTVNFERAGQNALPLLRAIQRGTISTATSCACR